MSKREDISGNKYNRLTAIEFSRYDKESHSSIWIFRCDCGNIIAKSKNAVNKRLRHQSDVREKSFKLLKK